MPLLTRIFRDDEPLTLRWNGWHLQCMAAAITQETAPNLWARYRAHEEAFQIIDELNKRPSLESTALDKLANIIHGQSADVWKEIWDNVRNQLAVNDHEGYQLKDDHHYKSPVESDMFGIKAGETLDLKAGDVLWFNL